MFDDWSDVAFAAWLAGFFDGEGCIQLPARGIDLSISNTDSAVISAIHARLGVGGLSLVRYDRKEWRDKYTWRVRNYTDAGAVLRMIRPYLLLKREKADLALARIDSYEAARRAMQERNRRIAEAASEGQSYAEIAAAFGLNARTVGYIVRGIIKDGSHPRRGKAGLVLEHRETKAKKSAGLGVRTKVSHFVPPPADPVRA